MARAATANRAASRNPVAQPCTSASFNACTEGAVVPAATAFAVTAPSVSALNDALVHGWATGFRLAALFAVAALTTALVALRTVRRPQDAEMTSEALVIEAVGGTNVEELIHVG